MSHLSESVTRLVLKIDNNLLGNKDYSDNEVEIFQTPYFLDESNLPKNATYETRFLDEIEKVPTNSIIGILTSPYFAASLASKAEHLSLKLWIAIRMENAFKSDDYFERAHTALLIISKDKGYLRHTKTRIAYSYCPSCDKTTKDYGGKKHLYHSYGTVMSDVWRDITVDFENSPDLVLDRLRDLFGLEPYTALTYHDLRNEFPLIVKERKFKKQKENICLFNKESFLKNGDCMNQLQSIPENCIDFCFADPPYNLKKKYQNWDDGIDIIEYFDWCDKWLTELARILKPGCTLAVLNIPQWAIRYFKHLNSILDFQDWIVWEGLSMPVRMIMPSHYSVICFSKGKPRRSPGISNFNNWLKDEHYSLTTIKQWYCSRPSCIRSRRKKGIEDTERVSNIWWDIHRLKHNSRRVDHPCQLPPLFMRRLISMFTYDGEVVFDPFNGVGTTTLTASQLGRKYIGFDVSEYYHKIAYSRHDELNIGLDPFRKNHDKEFKAKNSPVKRLKKQKYKVSKKKLQLEVKQIAEKIGHIPTKKEVEEFSKYPIEYFESYFINWGEVTAATRANGMTETR